VTNDKAGMRNGDSGEARPMSILVCGANGQVGWEVVRQGRAAGLDVLALARQELDIADADAVRRCFVQIAPRVVINCAAYTAVDRAEKEIEQAFAANRQGPANLAAACRRAAIPLLHLSTDYVFDGSKASPYKEDDPVAPLGVYGQSKWEGEEAVRNTLAHHIILRVSWVFGVHGHNFVKTMLRLGSERDELRVVNDQKGCPTAAADIAATLLRLATAVAGKEAVAWGTYHYCGVPATTWYEFAKQIFATAEHIMNRPSPRLIPIPTSEYPTPAKRPANSVLDCGKLESRFGIRAAEWSAALQSMIAELGGRERE